MSKISDKVQIILFWICVAIMIIASIITIAKAAFAQKSSSPLCREMIAFVDTAARADSADQESSSPLCREMIALVDTAARADSADAARLLLLPYEKEIRSAATRYGIPAALIAGVIQNESEWLEWSARAEPSYLRNRKIQHAARKWALDHRGLPTYQTELNFRATSMGLMQPMGELAREQGDTDRYLSSLFFPKNSIEQGAKKLATLLKKYKRDTLAAISAYNQGTARKIRGAFANARYVYRVQVAMLAWEHYFKQHTHAYDLRHGTKKTHWMARPRGNGTRNTGIAPEFEVQRATFNSARNQNYDARGHSAANGLGVAPRYGVSHTLARQRASESARVDERSSTVDERSSTVDERSSTDSAAGLRGSDADPPAAIWLITGLCLVLFGYLYLDWRHRRTRPGYTEHLSRYEIGPFPRRS